MKKRIALLIAIVVVVLFGGTVLAQPNVDTSDTWFCVQPASASAADYHLTSETLRPSLDVAQNMAQDNAWHVSGTASGGGYRLQEGATPRLTGSGCCCTYLPLILR